MIIECIKEGFHITHKNWQVILLRLAVMFLNFIGFLLFMILPVVIAFVYFGMDIFNTDSLLNILKNPMELFSKYVGLAIFILLAFIFYLCFASVLIMFVLGGTLGVLRNSAFDSQCKFSFASFWEEGKKLFFPLISFSVIAFLGFIVISVILSILGAVSFFLIYAYGGKGASLTIFLTYFLILMLIFSGITVILGAFTLVTYGMTALVVDRVGSMDAFRRGITFIKNKPNALLFYATLVISFILVNLILLSLSFPFRIIPVVGPLINIPYQLISYAIQSYLTVVMWGSLLIFYIKNINLINH